MMKKYRKLLLIGLMLIALIGGYGWKKAGNAGGTMTIMIYMVGSDLESATAAATNDMMEMEESGVDLSKVNLLIYTGGSPKWHNEKVEIPTDCNGMFELTKNGFSQVTEFEEMSMGESESLQRFLDYGYANYPADSYNLILWDHGNGPVIGYGKDLKYDKDVLTLPEIEKALQDSPFGEECKLDFIGFDACLMASAELACTVDAYARYMIASQEVEPGFGWNYAFLEKCGKVGTEELTKVIVDEYMKYCEDYFAEHEFFQSEVTLAVVDLSYCAELQASINHLFSVASEDVSGSYNQLALERVETRGFGRATTGSEYDLVDIQALMESMGGSYENETGAVKDVLGKMIVYSASNTAKSSGMSLYYPYYNKKYYENSWKTSYAQLGIFPNYLEYLNRFEQIWLGTDMKDAFEGKLVAGGGESGIYTLQLNESQAEHYVDGGYYILERLGEDVYSPIYYSKEVTHEDGLLTANFEGKVLYYKDDYGTQGIPVSAALDRVDGKTRYQLINLLVTDSGDYESEETMVCQTILSVDPESEEVKVLDFSEREEEGLQTGKNPQVNLQDWKEIRFYKQKGRYLTRNENGQICSFVEWPENGWIIWNEMYLANGLDFSYEPIYANGKEYFLMFDLKDAQGNGYSSELYPITLQEKPQQEQGEVSQVGMLQDGSLEIFNRNGVKLYLEFMKDRYDYQKKFRFTAENSNDFPVRLTINEMLIDGSINAKSSSCYMTMEAFGKESGDLTYLTNNCQMAGIVIPKTLEFCVELTDAQDGKTLINKERFSLRIAEDAKAPIRYQEMLGVCAAEQLLLDEPNGIRASLIGMGTTDEEAIDDFSEFQLLLKLENNGQTAKTISLDVALNGKHLAPEAFYYYDSPAGMHLEPGQYCFYPWSIKQENIKEAYGIETISSVTPYLNVTENGVTVTKELEIALSEQSAVEVKFAEQSAVQKAEETVSSCVLYEQDGLKLTLRAVLDPEWGGTYYFIQAENQGEEQSEVEIRDFVVNDKIFVNDYDGTYLDPGQQKELELSVLKKIMNLTEETSISSFEFQLKIKNEMSEEAKEQSVKIRLEKPLAPEMCFDSWAGSGAQEQILLDDERVKVTLLGWGQIPRTNVKAVLRFENKSREKIPVQVSGISLDGVFVECYDSIKFLMPGECSYSYINVIDSTWEETKLSSISDVKLLILTKEEENTGVMNYDGGSWYPVSLAEKGEVVAGPEKGRLLEKLGEIEIYEVSQSKTEQEYSEEVVYIWELEIVNQSEDHIEVEIKDLLRDGVSQEELEKKNSDELFSYAGFWDLGSRTKRHVTLRLRCAKDVPRPELSFKFEIKSMAGDEILYTGKENVKIIPEKE